MDDVDIEAEFFYMTFSYRCFIQYSTEKLNQIDKNLLEGHLPLRVNMLDSLTRDAPQRRLSPTEKIFLKETYNKRASILDSLVLRLT